MNNTVTMRRDVFDNVLKYAREIAAQEKMDDRDLAVAYASALGRCRGNAHAILTHLEYIENEMKIVEAAA